MWETGAASHIGKLVNIYSSTMTPPPIFDIIKPFIYPTNAQLDCSKIMSKFTLIFTSTLKMLLHVSV